MGELSKEVALLIIGVLLGALASGTVQWKLSLDEKELEQRNIAQALYIDISRTEEGSIDFLKDFDSNNNSGIDLNVSDFVYAGTVLYILTPIYTDNGLYFTFQKDISMFDSNLSANLYSYYSKLLSAERDRRYVYECISKDPTGQNLTIDEKTNSLMASTSILLNLIDSVILAEYLKAELKAIYKLNINLAASEKPSFAMKGPLYKGKLSPPAQPFEVTWTPINITAKNV